MRYSGSGTKPTSPPTAHTLKKSRFTPESDPQRRSNGEAKLARDNQAALRRNDPSTADIAAPPVTLNDQNQQQPQNQTGTPLKSTPNDPASDPAKRADATQPQGDGKSAQTNVLI